MKDRSLIVWLVLACAAGLALALTRRDLAWFIEPAMGVMMIVMGAGMGAFFLFGRVFEGPAGPPSDVARSVAGRPAWGRALCCSG